MGGKFLQKTTRKIPHIGVTVVRRRDLIRAMRFAHGWPIERDSPLLSFSSSLCFVFFCF